MLQGSDRPGQFARCRIGIEGQMADYPTVQIIKGRQTARQDLRSDVPQQQALATAAKREPSTIQTSLKCSRRVWTGDA